MKKTILITTLLTTSLLAVGFNACANCHGQKAQKRALGKSQIIQGWSIIKLRDALNGYKYGTYGGTLKGVMKTQVVRLNDEDITKLAETISKF